MTSMWQRWTTPCSSDDFLPAAEEGGADCSDTDDSLPKQVHVGLSIDSYSHKSETSSLSDFEEGMPLWARDNTPPRCNLRTLNSGQEDNCNDDDDNDCQDEPPNDRPHTPLNLEEDPIGFQLPIPRRCPISLDCSPHTSTLTQRSKNSHISVALPVLPMNNSQLRWRDDEIVKMDPFQLHNGTTKKISSLQKMMRMFCAVLAIGLMAVSVHQHLDPDLWWERQGGKLRPDLPTFETQKALRLATFDDTNNNNKVPQRRSNLAFARASSQLPVFETQSDDEPLTDISNSSPFVSFLGGCAFVAILLETGWKGYQKSKVQRGKSQAVRRLYKQTN